MPHARISRGADAAGGLRALPLPRFLFDTRQAKAIYLAKAWLLVFLPSIALSAAISLLVRAPAGPDLGPVDERLFLLLAVFAPVAETLLMVPPLLLLDRLLGPRAAVVLSAVLWALLHSLQAPVWGLVVWWPFLIFSLILLIWRRHRRLATGMLIVVAVHGLQNAVAGALLLLGR